MLSSLALESTQTSALWNLHPLILSRTIYHTARGGSSECMVGFFIRCSLKRRRGVASSREAIYYNTKVGPPYGALRHNRYNQNMHGNQSIKVHIFQFWSLDCCVYYYTCYWTYPGNRDSYNLAIYTLRLSFFRMYVVNATELIPVLQKQ